jgi:hypothetical protein
VGEAAYGANDLSSLAHGPAVSASGSWAVQMKQSQNNDATQRSNHGLNPSGKHANLPFTFQENKVSKSE